MSDCENTAIIFNCPHCNIPVLISQLNCRIFRHGVFISTGEQINPHSSQHLCDEYVKNKLIYGCGRPFQIINEASTYKAVICDYI
jgi:hypothetical protein